MEDALADLLETDSKPGVPMADEGGGANDDLRDRVVARVGATDLRRAVRAVSLGAGGGAGGACERACQLAIRQQ